MPMAAITASRALVNVTRKPSPRAFTSVPWWRTTWLRTRASWACSTPSHRWSPRASAMTVDPQMSVTSMVRTLPCGPYRSAAPAPPFSLRSVRRAAMLSVDVSPPGPVSPPAPVPPGAARSMRVDALASASPAAAWAASMVPPAWDAPAPEPEPPEAAVESPPGPGPPEAEVAPAPGPEPPELAIDSPAGPEPPDAEVAPAPGPEPREAGLESPPGPELPAPGVAPAPGAGPAVGVPSATGASAVLAASGRRPEPA